LFGYTDYQIHNPIHFEKVLGGETGEQCFVM